ncbi:MAG: FAD-dependent oxidoreductase [bacterium]|nr:FAD-dependent oxidoreductase [bacterium]
MNLDDIVKEAARCIDCKTKPCMVACPAHNNIPDFMKAVKNRQFEEARAIWHMTSNMPELCGNLCQNDTLCVGHCTLMKIKKPIQIGFVEAGIAQYFKDVVDYPTTKKNKTHLVIGLGPSGMANALKMKELGYDVTCMDKQDHIGGTVYNMVPDFRFDKVVLSDLTKKFQALEIPIQYHIEVGRDVFLNDLTKEYDSIYIAHGLDSPQVVEVETSGVMPYYAVDLLDKHKYTHEQLSSMLGHECAIVGLGNVAIDMARTLVRLGKSVTILYRRTIQEAPAGHHEIMDAVEEGVVIKELLGPIKFYKMGEAKFLDCEQNCLIRDPQSTRSIIEKVKDSKISFELDELIFATGQASTDSLFRNTGIKLLPEISPYHTTLPHVFVGGDRVNRHKRIVDAMVSGLEVAAWIEKENK